MGDSLLGQGMVFWLPLDGYNPGFNPIGTLERMIDQPCLSQGGSVVDYPVVIGPPPESGQLRVTLYPNNDFFPIVGLTSILCPGSCMGCIGTEETSWGAIRSLHR
jgi:hypothetical protein